MQMLFELDLASAQGLLLPLLIPVIPVVLAFLTVEDSLVMTATQVSRLRVIIIIRQLKRLSQTRRLQATQPTKATQNIETSCFALALLTLQQLVQ